MLKKFVLAFAILALAAAFAGTIPTHGPACTITITQPSVVKGVDLAPGDYRVTVDINKATFVGSSKHAVTVDVKVENVATKFDSTAVRFTLEAGKQSLSEIRIGGAKTKLVFD